MDTIGDEIERKAADAKDALGDAIEDLGLTEGSEAAEVEDSYERAVQSARSTYEQAGATARAIVTEGEARLVERTDERPVTMLLVSLAIGFVFGRAL